MKNKAFTIIELLTVAAIIAILSAILFPVFTQARSAASKTSNKVNIHKIAAAARNYGDDWDERIPIMINGYYHSLKNTKDGVLTTPYNEGRTDSWVMLLLPYLKDRTVYVDPTRGDVNNIFAGPALGTQDPGYDPLANTFRTQNRFPMFGVNFEFLSPLVIPGSKMDDAMPTDWMHGESRAFFNAEDPRNTVFYTVTARGYVGQDISDNLGVLDSTRGFFAVDPPGEWSVHVASTTPYTTFWNGTFCSGDWCIDADPSTVEQDRRTNFFYLDPAVGGNNVAFLDGHVRFMSDVELAAGTNYLTSTPNDGGSGYFGGGAVITDKSKYLWNLDNFYYGL